MLPFKKLNAFTKPSKLDLPIISMTYHFFLSKKNISKSHKDADGLVSNVTFVDQDIIGLFRLWDFLFPFFFQEVTWVFPQIMVPQNGWFIMEHPIKMDDLGLPLFLERPTYNPQN